MDGDALDSSGSGFDGTVVGGTSFVTDGSHNAALFNGSDGYISIDNANELNFSDALTVEGWVKLNTIGAGNQATIAGKWNDLSGNYREYLLTVNAFGQATFYLSSTGSDYPKAMWNTPLTTGVWYHLAGTYDGSNIKLYVDEDLKATTPFTSNLSINTEQLLIGANDGYGGGLRKFTDGYIDDVRIWKTALTEEELGMTDEELILFLDVTAPILTADFTADNVAMPKSVTGQYILVTNGVSTDNHELQFTDESNSDELLKDELFSLYLDPSGVDTVALVNYYNSRTTMPDFYRNYLIDALDGSSPFAYITGDEENNLFLHDAAQYDLAQNYSIGMVIPDDYPVGVYPVEGVVKDLAGNPTTAAYTLVVIRDLADLTPEIAYNPVGTEHTYTTNIGVPVEGVNILFTVTGANPEITPVLTGANGDAVFTYTGVNPGEDKITACIDADIDGECEGDTTNTATKIWLDKFVTGGGVVKGLETSTIMRGKKPYTVQSEVVKYTFGGNVGIDVDGEFVGQFQINDHVAGISCHFNKINNFVFLDGETVKFNATGNCNNSDEEKTVDVTIVDRGEPGINDEIFVTGYNLEFEADPITGGNFQVRPPVARTIELCKKDPENNWQCVTDGASGVVSYSEFYEETPVQLSATGLLPNTYYQVEVVNKGANCTLWNVLSSNNPMYYAQTNADGNLDVTFDVVLSDYSEINVKYPQWANTSGGWVSAGGDNSYVLYAEGTIPNQCTY